MYEILWTHYAYENSDWLWKNYEKKLWKNMKTVSDESSSDSDTSQQPPAPAKRSPSAREPTIQGQGKGTTATNSTWRWDKELSEEEVVSTATEGDEEDPTISRQLLRKSKRLQRKLQKERFWDSPRIRMGLCQPPMRGMNKITRFLKRKRRLLPKSRRWESTRNRSLGKADEATCPVVKQHRLPALWKGREGTYMD